MSLSNRDHALQNLTPPLEYPFSDEEFADRLSRIRNQMAVDKLDVLFLTSPEAINWVSGYQCEWYQAQSPKACRRC